MGKNEQKMSLPKITLDDFFTTQEQRDDDKLDKVIEIKLSEIDSFPNHPFKIIENEEMQNMVESVIENGVLEPALVRQKEDGRYEMISGHRRKRASELAGNASMPCIVKNLTDDEATIIMVDSNIQREEILPSEKAFAYKMKLEAISHQGKYTSRQVGEKLLSVDEVGLENGDSGRQVQRYIRLTELIPEILDMVDCKKIAFSPAVELSFLNKEEQLELLDCMQCFDATPSLSQAQKMKKISISVGLDSEKIDEILSEEKANQIPMVKLPEEKLRKVLPNNLSNQQIEDYIIKAIEWYNKYQKQKKMDAR